MKTLKNILVISQAIENQNEDSSGVEDKSVNVVADPYRRVTSLWHDIYTQDTTNHDHLADINCSIQMNTNYAFGRKSNMCKK